MRAEDTERLLVEVGSRVTERMLARAARSKDAFLDNLIQETFYYEGKRLETDSTAVAIKQDREWLREMRSAFRTASESRKKEIVREMVDRHAREVVGRFSEPVYRMSTLVLPVGLGFLLNAMSPLKLLRTLPGLPNVAENLAIQGEVGQIQALDKLGTIIMVPTHVSNMDSPLAGYSIYRLDLPPFTYGAGLNLFQHKLMGFFMHRLGAYKVDRLKRHSLYKEVLKEYATVTIELGYDNLFFPGGTRSRSGAVEQKLKLGLLGCGLQAYLNNLKAQKAKPKIYVVPCTINYQLVLEAENLIEDHLKAAGKSRYIIMDDEFSMPSRIYSFLHNLATLDAKVHFTVGPALDPFGNPVDENGESIDPRGRSIDIARYVTRNGALVDDPERDAEFTRELGTAVVSSFMKDTVVFATHVVAWSVFEMLREQNPDPDFFRFLREGGRQAAPAMIDVYRRTADTLSRVRRLADRGAIRVSVPAGGDRAEDVVDKALQLFGCYHTKPVLERRGDRLFPTDMNLLYYYRNRLWGYGIESMN